MQKPIYIVLLQWLYLGCFAQTWSAKLAIPGSAYDYQGGISFELHGKIYVGGGYYSKSFYMYDPITDTWTAKADLPGCTYSRYQGIGFSLNGYGYTAFGEDNYTVSGTFTKLTDIWKYNDTTDKWSLAPAFPDHFRFSASVFVIKNKAYIFGGADSNNYAKNETWEFDGTSWAQKANHPQSNIAGSATFVLNGKGYSVGGFKATGAFGVYISNTYQYDPTTNTWTSKAIFPGAGRADFFGFNTLTKGYCGLGSSLNISTFTFTYYNDIYTYDDATDRWGSAITNFIGADRQQGFAASLGNYAYIGGGYSYLSTIETFYTDWYVFSEEISGITESGKPENYLYPNPCHEELNINYSINKSEVVVVTDIFGKEVLRINNIEDKINTSNLSSGIYFLHIGNNTKHKFIKQ